MPVMFHMIIKRFRQDFLNGHKIREEFEQLEVCTEIMAHEVPEHKMRMELTIRALRFLSVTQRTGWHFHKNGKPPGSEPPLLWKQRGEPQNPSHIVIGQGHVGDCSKCWNSPLAF